jgi:hypothetical protein
LVDENGVCKICDFGLSSFKTGRGEGREGKRREGSEGRERGGIVGRERGKSEVKGARRERE